MLIHRSLTRLPLLKEIQNGDTFWEVFIWYHHLLMLNQTTVNSLFVSIMAFSLTWCNKGAGFFAEGFNIEKIHNGDTFWGAFIRSRHLLMLDDTAIISLSDGIEALSPTWCNFEAIFCAEGFFNRIQSPKWRLGNQCEWAMEGRDFKFCICVYNGVKQWSCNGNLPITGSLLRKCENVNFSVKIQCLSSMENAITLKVSWIPYSNFNMTVLIYKFNLYVW